jgi:carbon-monoxide dehydrogenase medium subunit
MYQIAYHHCDTLDRALALFAELDEPSYISGGFTLIPAMKNRLAAPSNLIDLRAIPELNGISVENGRLVVGAATCHADVATSALVAATVPALGRLAGSIGDMQVRHMGTIGGSVANNDPAADYPAAVLGLQAIIVTDRREIPAEEYFTGLYSTALEEGEIILRIAFLVPRGASYAKFRNPASKFALAASFVVRAIDGSVRVGVTGASGNGTFRWTEAEEALAARFEPTALDDLRPDAADMLSDLHGGSDYRAELVRVMTARAVEAQTAS